MKHVNFKLIPLLLIAAAFALVGAGCGSNDTEAASETATTEAAMKQKEAEAMKMKEAKAMKAEAAMKAEKAMRKKAGTAMKPAGAASGGAMIAANHTIATGTVDPYGKILQDGEGHSIYIFTKETGKKSECYDECAAAWPPVLTKGAPTAGKGVTASKLGTTKRTDGTTQVTYKGQPLYFYVGENDKPDEVLCQAVDEFGGIWYVVDPDGKSITSS